MKLMCGIYKIKNLINNKIYIGQSLNIKARWEKHKKSKDNCAIHQALRKYGINNFSFEVIEECPPELLNEREIFWIKEYNSYNEGYNMTLGGEGSLKRAIQSFNELGEFVKEYNSITEAALDTNTSSEKIISVCQHYPQRFYAGNYQWKYADDKTIILPREKQKSKNIYQFDLNGNFIQRFSSLTEAANELNIDKSKICACCNGRQKTAYGYQWSYSSTIEKIKYKPPYRAVQQFSKDGEFIKEFKSISEAARKLKTTPGNVCSVCQGRSKSCKGYIFRYKE